ncbi:MAG: metallophosphoesterase family protein [Candidatus Heimdallarchaeota archaeon]
MPNKPTFEVQGIRFGVYHGTDIHPRADIRQLKTIADDLQVKVLFNGHSHKTLVYNDDTHILLNPGTSTGASGGSSWTVDTGIITVALTQDELMIDLFVITEKRKMRKESIKVLL